MSLSNEVMRWHFTQGAQRWRLQCCSVLKGSKVVLACFGPFHCCCRASSVCRGSTGISLRQHVISSGTYDSWLTGLCLMQTSLWALPTAIWMSVPLGGWALLFVFFVDSQKDNMAAFLKMSLIFLNHPPEQLYESIYSFLKVGSFSSPLH